MRSTYDRQGRNHHADASHFLYQLANDRNVTLDVEGPGVLYFARYNHWHGSPWKYVVDGQSHIVQETSTGDPNRPDPNSVFQPDDLFPQPLAWTWAATKGADLSWTPIPFERSFRMEYSRTRYGTGYYIFHQYVGGAKLSQPIRAWDAKTPPASEVLELIGKSGSDIAPLPGSPEGQRLGVKERLTTASLAGLETKHILRLDDGPGLIRAVKLSLPREQASMYLRSVCAPRGTIDDIPRSMLRSHCFSAGSLYNHDDREYLVKAFPVSVRFTSDRIELACYFPHALLPISPIRARRQPRYGLEGRLFSPLASIERSGGRCGVLPRHVPRSF